MSHSYDLIVLGLGAMGSAAAYHAAARGKRVLGLEKFTAAHNLGSSHGESRIIRQAYHENPNYVPLALRAYELWERLERDTGISLLEKCGGLMIGPPGSSVVEGAILSARQHGLAYETLDARELKRRFPPLNPRPSETAMFEAVAGFLRPEKAIQAHLQLALNAGADLHFNEPVHHWSASGSDDSVEIKTNLATYTASSLIIAPGAWAPNLLNDLRFPFEVQRRVMCWFRPQADVAQFSSTRFPIYIWDVDGANIFYGFPATDSSSEGVKVAMHSGGEATTAETVDRSIRAEDIDELSRYLQQFIPALDGRCLKAAACLYTMTPDEHFILGLHPRHARVAIAAGFSGHGFKFSAAIGEILAGLALDGKTDQPIDFLSPQRFNLPASK